MADIRGKNRKRPCCCGEHRWEPVTASSAPNPFQSVITAVCVKCGLRRFADD